MIDPNQTMLAFGNFSPASAAVSAFETALAALQPIRWYPLDDRSLGTVAHDLGSQHENGNYGSTNGIINFSQGLVPTRVNSIEQINTTDNGFNIPVNGLPSGGQSWTIGTILYIFSRGGTSAGLAWSYNHNDQSGADLILYWNSFTTGVTAGGHNINVGTTIIDTLLLTVATYNGTTLSYYLFTPIRSLGSSSVAVALNITPVAPSIAAGHLDYLMQDAFMLDYAASRAQLAALAASLLVV